MMMELDKNRRSEHYIEEYRRILILNVGKGQL